jgi:hypothetical protein
MLPKRARTATIVEKCNLPGSSSPGCGDAGYSLVVTETDRSKG